MKAFLAAVAMTMALLAGLTAWAALSFIAMDAPPDRIGKALELMKVWPLAFLFLFPICAGICILVRRMWWRRAHG